MKHPWLLSVVALAFSAIAIAVGLLDSSASGASAAPEPVAPIGAAPDAELSARLDALVEENRRLRERVASLELRPVASERSSAGTKYATREELEELRAELRIALAGGGALAASPAVGTPLFKEQVASTLVELRREEAVQAVRAGLEKRTARLDATIPKLTEWLELSTHQAAAMRVALEARYEREEELVRLWEQGGEPALLGVRKQSDHQAFVDDLSAILTPEQLETYQRRGGEGK